VEVVAEATPDLDRGRAQVGEVLPEALTDLTRDREPAGARTPAARGAISCRYCGNVQESGAACERCGYRLPRAARPTPSREPSAEPIRARCRGCGTPGVAGLRCPECGREVPFPEV
jgi:hypothetical protein